jgi:methanethiol S-methyltransferase
MYGYPLTIYLLSGWLQSRPNIDWFSHDAGHLLEMLFGWRGRPALRTVPSPELRLHRRWLHPDLECLERAVRSSASGRIGDDGPYAHVRHPQYVGFILVLFGFLLQWPTLLTLAMFPILVWMYVRLARQEERMALAAFGDAYARYAQQVPGFIPRLSCLVERST